MTEYIYILKLREGKYYVGKSVDPERRIRQHKGGEGSAWTRRFPLLHVVQVSPMTHTLEETETTKRLMLEHGIDNVRGGPYSQMVLPAETVDSLEAEFCAADDRCFGCGDTGHFFRDCPEFSPPRLSPRRRNPVSHSGRSRPSQGCSRCGRNGHLIQDCYARTDVAGNLLETELSTDDSSSSMDDSSSSTQGCFRCGRSSHWIQDCYARTDVAGNLLPN